MQLFTSFENSLVFFKMVSRSRESDGFEDFHIPDEDLQVLQDQLWGDDVGKEKLNFCKLPMLRFAIAR